MMYKLNKWKLNINKMEVLKIGLHSEGKLNVKKP